LSVNSRSRFRDPGSRLLFTFVVAPLVLAGCGRSERAAEATPAGGAAKTYEWVVSEAGVGPVAIGMRSDDLQGIVDTLGRIGDCVYSSPLESVASGFSRKDVLIMLVDGVVARIDVIAPSVATTAGARVGDSEGRIKELYPSARVEPHKYTDGHYLVVDGTTLPNRRFVFETDGSKVTRYRSGAVPQVDWVEGCS
jgi:hypothetical protein